MLKLKKKTVTIVGARRSGLALVRLVRRAGGEPRLTDGREAAGMDESDLQALHEQEVVTEFGGHTRDFLEGSDYVVLSPGVSIKAPIVQWATELSIPVMGEIEFAFQFAEAPVIGVTGSNGKTTVVNLIYRVLREAGMAACLCGNVGHPFSNYCLDGQIYGYYVLELSSFQLESLLPRDDPLVLTGDIIGFRPHIGVLLNFSENHLDRHRDLEEYFCAKWKLFQNQLTNDHAVLNTASTQIAGAMDNLTAKSWLLVDSNDGVLTPGDENPNFRAVRRVSAILNIHPDVVNTVLTEFKGVEHRMEFVRSLGGVTYINDSKSTTAEAGRWALNRVNGPVIMICGGRDKNIDFTLLKDLIQQRVKTLFVIGEAKAKLKQTFSQEVPVRECRDLTEAVRLAKEAAISGDSVLLSPMCASFDMFKDFEQRGAVYKKIVQDL